MLKQLCFKENIILATANGTEYSKMDQVKFVEGRQPLKNFTWSILEYFVPNDIKEVFGVNIISKISLKILATIDVNFNFDKKF